ncbi:MAG TPA: neprosin family prolyl endopeptidase [Thermoanaerobaculia bacterium]
MKRTFPFLLAATLLAACAGTRTSDTRSAASFTSFVAATRAAAPDAYVGRDGFAVANAAEMRRMQAHLAALYEGVTSSRAVRDSAGTLFDCIPIERQPGLRGGKPLLTPRMPTLPSGPAGEGAGPRGRAIQPNSVGCGARTIPMRRITLEQMARFRTLEEYLTRKKKRHSVAGTDDDDGVHYYATAEQVVDAYGAGTDMSIWQPVVPSGPNDSISQVWVSGGSGAEMQTAEAGWMVYPVKNGTDSPVLFEFWTPDGYASGCYDLECPGFVQTNKNWTLGGAVGPISQPGGDQSVLRVTWWRDSLDGAWWLYLGHTTLQAVGYISQSYYGTGQMSKNATEVEFGGETTTLATAGQMGSGAHANAGYGYAAFQTRLSYYPTTGGIVPMKPTTLKQRTPQCYTVTATSEPELTYIYYGGPQCP